MVDALALALATGSLLVAAVTLYLTYLHKGKLRLTKPTALFFVRDGPSGPLKIVVTALLYSTGKRGQVIESMFIKLIHDGLVSLFKEWIYWEGDRVHLGGVKVGEEGRTMFDHFLLSDENVEFVFKPGKYILEIYASQLGAQNPVRLFGTEFILESDKTEAVRPGGPGFALLWDPDAQSYDVQIGPPRSHSFGSIH